MYQSAKAKDIYDMIVTRILVLILAALALALPGRSSADIFGFSENTQLVTGHGYDPTSPSEAKQSPFLDLSVARESGGPSFQYKLEVTSDISNSTRDQYFGAELQGRVGFWNGRASVNLSSQRSMFRSAFVLNIYAKVDYPAEYLVNTTNANLNFEAIALTNNPAGWIAKYGSQIVTRRTRGGLIVGSIIFASANSTSVNTMKAALYAAGANATWSASISANLTSKVTDAIRTLNGSVSLQGYGGRGFTDLVPETGADLSDFQTFVNLINNYMSHMTADNAAITGYQTASFRQYCNRGSDPFTPTAADAYLRYMSLQAKAEALSEYILNAPTQTPWVPSDQLAALAVQRDVCKARADETWDFGTRLVRSPKSIIGRILPADVVVEMPKYALETPIVEPYGGGIKIKLTLTGAHQIYCRWHRQVDPGVSVWALPDVTQDTPGGTYFEINTSPSQVHAYPDLYLEFIDERGRSFFLERRRLLR